MRMIYVLLLLYLCVCMCPHIIEVKGVCGVYQYIFSCEDAKNADTLDVASRSAQTTSNHVTPVRQSLLQIRKNILS
jgi:hypothetical protein